jgi:hypothetical protein
MSRAETWLAAVLTVVAIAPVWAVAHPPLQDYPYHLARVNVLAQWDDPALAYPETFTVSAYPAPYVLSDWLMAGLGRALAGVGGVETAGKIVLSLYLGLFPWSLIYLARSVDPEAGVVGLLGFPLAFNWHFHMGFVSYVLSLPIALFALGWWWRNRRETGAHLWRGAWRATGVMALLVLLTYLAHIYAFGVLGFVLVILAVDEGWGMGRLRGAAVLLARTLLACLPALLLLAGAVLRNVGRSAGSEGPILLLYGNLKRKVLLALGSLPSFDLAWETALFALGVATALALAAVAWRAGRRPCWSLLWTAALLVVLYVVLPDHLGRVFFVSNRVPMFVLLLGLVALPMPVPGTRTRTVAAAFLAALALLHVGSLTLRYQEIDRQLDDYAAALAELPADARVAFRVDREAMTEGRIAPAALFGGYHYLRAPGSRIPDLEHFVGTIRTVDYRSDRGRSLSTASAGSREELEDLLGRPWIVGLGGMMVVVGEETPLLRSTAVRFGFRPADESVGPATFWRKVEPVYRETPEEPVYATGYEKGWDYLVTYGAAEEDLENGAAETVFRRGRAAVHRCRAEAGCATSEREAA